MFSVVMVRANYVMCTEIRKNVDFFIIEYTQLLLATNLLSTYKFSIENMSSLVPFIGSKALTFSGLDNKPMASNSYVYSIYFLSPLLLLWYLFSCSGWNEPFSDQCSHFSFLLSFKQFKKPKWSVPDQIFKIYQLCLCLILD